MLRYRDFPVLAGALIAAYLAVLVWPGFTMHFAPDDMQNLYTYWSAGVWKVIYANLLFATSFYRPMGGLFYLPMFKVFGFNPVPYRIVISILLGTNVWLLYCFARRITGSRECAGFATPLGCFHSTATGVYGSNAMIYEVLCFSFLVGTLLYYVRIRESGRGLGFRELIILVLLFMGALNSKEMAVVLPAILVLYELLYHRSRPWMLRELGAIVLTGAMSAIYLLGKLFGANTLARFEAYRPTYTLQRYLETSGIYAGDLLLSPQPLTPAMTILFWAGLIAAAFLLRRRNMVFGAGFAFLSFLPLNFVPPREGFVLYIPLVGFAIYGADLIVFLLDRVRRPAYRLQVAAMAFVACLGSLGYVYAGRAQEDFASMLHAQEPTWVVLKEFERLHPRLQRGAKILLTDSPIENNWDVYFIAKLYFGDRTVRAAWMRSSNPVVYGDVHGDFDHEFRFTGPTLFQAK